MIINLLQKNKNFTEIRLWNLDFPSQDGEEILNVILDQEYEHLETFDLRQNPKWWDSENSCTEMLKIIISKLSNLTILDLRGNHTLNYQELLDDAPTIEAKESIQK